MKIVVQRVKSANVKVEQKEIGTINKGLLLLVAFKYNDTEDIIDYMINKILKLRIFDDELGVMNKNILDIDGKILSISQFTLYGNTKKCNRPSYSDSMNRKEAEILYNSFNEKLKQFIKLETGKFGSDMQISLINDGPVTIILEKENDL